MPDIIFPNLGITIENLNRVAFTVFGFDIFWYALFVVLGIIAGVFFGAYFAPKKTGQDPILYLDFAMITVPSCIIGARIFFVIFSWEQYRHNLLSIFNLRSGGLAIFGVVIMAFLTAFIYCWRKKVNFFHFADTGVVGLIIGHAIGRFGNFVNREAFGGYTDSLFAMQARLDQVHNIGNVTPDMVVLIDGIQYIQVHPTFFYESAILIILFIALNIYRKRKKFNGEIFAYYFLVYGIARFFIEGIRTDQLLAGAMPVSQLTSALLAATGAIMLIVGYIRYFRNKINSPKIS